MQHILCIFTHATYHQNASTSSTIYVGMFANRLPVLSYFKLLLAKNEKDLCHPALLMLFAVQC